MCRTPSLITPTQSLLRCTIFVILILHDCVVGTVVEQVYNSTFKFCLLKNRINLSPKRFIFTSKCTEMRLVAGLRPLVELTAQRGGEGEREREWKGG